MSVEVQGIIQPDFCYSGVEPFVPHNLPFDFVSLFLISVTLIGSILFVITCLQVNLTVGCRASSVVLAFDLTHAVTQIATLSSNIICFHEVVLFVYILFVPVLFAYSHVPFLKLVYKISIDMSCRSLFVFESRTHKKRHELYFLVPKVFAVLAAFLFDDYLVCPEDAFRLEFELVVGPETGFDKVALEVFVAVVAFLLVFFVD